jgi:hypothetical protein
MTAKKGMRGSPVMPAGKFRPAPAKSKKRY